MSDISFLSNIAMIDWNSVLQCYLDRLNITSLIQSWQQGNAFSQQDWQTFMVLNINIFILFSLVQLLIKVHRKSVFSTWIQNRRSQLEGRPKSEDQTRLEAKITDSTCLRQAYNLHRFAMYDHALDKYRQAFYSHSDEINTYLVGIRIIAEMQEPNKQFIQFFQTVIANLRKKHPAIWREVAKYGRKKAPTLDQWQLEA
ncbi:MAG: hypothetical protein R8K54_02130 [Mariprofundaceae bacterium]